MENTDNKDFIDVNGIFKQKSPTLYRFTPNFIINSLRRLLHEDEINDFIKTNKNLPPYEFVVQILEEFNVKLEFSGIENIPPTGGCVIAANHPLGGLDALALINAVTKVRKDMKFIVNDVLLQLQNLKGIFTGVNKFGRTKTELLNSIDDLYNSGQAILIFPAGLVSRKSSDGNVKDLEWKKSFVSKAKKYNIPVIPVYIDGRNTNRFYNFSNFRKMIGLQLNIEMLLLPDEMYKQKDKTVTINFGKPIFIEQIQKGKSDTQVANEIKDIVYSMQNSDN